MGPSVSLAAASFVLVVLMIWLLNHLRSRLATPTALDTPAAKPIPIPPPKPRVTTPAKPTQNLKAKIKQPFNALLVLDVEGTCQLGSDFDYPNEIIEFPVVLLRYDDSGNLSKVDEFQTFVKPTWRPKLSTFCTTLTGITQTQVDEAPTFPVALHQFSLFLERHGLIDPVTGLRKKGVRFSWCTDTRADLQNFVLKQCFISGIRVPDWMAGDFMDVRKSTVQYLTSIGKPPSMFLNPSAPGARPSSFNIATQLAALGLDAFRGRQHSGIDDARNIARILVELSNRDVLLSSNSSFKTTKRWDWMGKAGRVLYQDSRPSP